MSEIQRIARMSELGTRVLSCQARILGMGAANRRSERNGDADAYGETEFSMIEGELDAYADELRRISLDVGNPAKDVSVDEKREKLWQFVRDAGPVLEKCGNMLKASSFIPQTAYAAHDLAARAEALLEGK